MNPKGIISFFPTPESVSTHETKDIVRFRRAGLEVETRLCQACRCCAECWRMWPSPGCCLLLFRLRGFFGGERRKPRLVCVHLVAVVQFQGCTLCLSTVAYCQFQRLESCAPGYGSSIKTSYTNPMEPLTLLSKTDCRRRFSSRTLHYWGRQYTVQRHLKMEEPC